MKVELFAYFRIQRLFDFAHVEDLLRIDVLIWEIDGQAVDIDPGNVELKFMDLTYFIVEERPSAEKNW